MRASRQAQTAPLVSILITAHNRPEELRETLNILQEQTYPALELIVIDDASDRSLESIVRSAWPLAQFKRNATNLGYIASRSAGMLKAAGQYILTLDDDSAPVAPDAIAQAVARFEREPELGVVAFRVHEGIDRPDASLAAGREQYTYAFVGCAEMMRAAAVHEVGGYRDFFEYYKEEADYSLRMIDRGWRILYMPSILVHHRMSRIGRSEARIVAYAFRNQLWTTLLNAPASRLVPELVWRIGVGGIELVKQGSARWILWSVLSTIAGLSRVLRERSPLSRTAVQQYDVLRFRQVHTALDLQAARAPGWRERWHYFRTTWWNRRRARAVWDTRSGGKGRGAWTTRDHDEAPAPNAPQ